MPPTASREPCHDSWLARRTPDLAAGAGFCIQSFRSHSLVETSCPDYLLTIVDRGADAMAGVGQISEALAAALKNEARQRVAAGRFFGQICYTSLIARKPAR